LEDLSVGGTILLNIINNTILNIKRTTVVELIVPSLNRAC
jgi:hypothetical protein